MKARLDAVIRTIPDFPKPGIQFKDITPLFQEPELLGEVIDALRDRYRSKNVDVVVGIEARGFLFGVPLALALGVPFVPVRKPGKLPAKTHRVDYELEYGSDALEIHADAIEAGNRVVVVDDLLATGGTLAASIELIQGVGGEVIEAAVLIELAFLKGSAKITPTPLYSLLTY